MLQSANFNSHPIDYTKKFGEISPQLERELIPRIQQILEQRDFNVTSILIRDVLADFHKMGDISGRLDSSRMTRKEKRNC